MPRYLKHGLISNDKMWADLINFDLNNPDLKQLQTHGGRISESKEDIVTIDPKRKASVKPST